MRIVVTFLFLSLALPIFGQTETQLQKENGRPCYVNDSTVNESTDELWVGPVTKEVSFKGDRTLNKFINDSLSKDVKKFIVDKNISGRMQWLLVIDKMGKVKDVKIAKGSIGPYVDEEIKRVLKLTSWNPAYVHEKPVARRVIIPVVL